MSTEKTFARKLHSAEMSVKHAVIKVQGLARRLNNDDGTRPGTAKIRADLEVARADLAESRRRLAVVKNEYSGESLVV